MSGKLSIEVKVRLALIVVWHLVMMKLIVLLCVYLIASGVSNLQVEAVNQLCSSVE